MTFGLRFWFSLLVLFFVSLRETEHVSSLSRVYLSLISQSQQPLSDIHVHHFVLDIFR
jgi:hypothetical protein